MKNFSYAVRATSIAQLKADFEQTGEDLYAKALAALSIKPASGEDLAMLRRFTGEAQPLPCLQASNSTARSWMVGGILPAFKQVRRRPGIEILHVTLLRDEWTTSDERTIVPLARVKAESRSLLSQICADWLGVVEIQAFSNRKHPSGGKLLSSHVHAIAFGRDIYPRACEIAAHHNARWTAELGGGVPVVVDRVRPTYLDLAHVVRYPWKAPARCKNVYINSAKGIYTINESEAGDRYIRYLRLLQILSLLELDRLVFASGEGVSIRSAALARAHAKLDQLVPPAKRATQMLLTAAFWADFMPRMGLTRFRTPVFSYDAHACQSADSLAKRGRLADA